MNHQDQGLIGQSRLDRLRDRKEAVGGQKLGHTYRAVAPDPLLWLRAAAIVPLLNSV